MKEVRSDSVLLELMWGDPSEEKENFEKHPRLIESHINISGAWGSFLDKKALENG
jgi:hypothetical protein